MVAENHLADSRPVTSKDTSASSASLQGGRRQTEVIPGFLWIQGPEGYNALLAQKNGSQITVPLHPHFAVDRIKEVRRNKAYRVFGTDNANSSRKAFTLLYGQNGRPYAVGKSAQTGLNGRLTANQTTLSPILQQVSRQGQAIV